jgi:hypothetical protein
LAPLVAKHLDRGIGAYGRTRTAAGAPGGIHEMSHPVPLRIQVLRERNVVLRTCQHAQFAPFAVLVLDDDVACGVTSDG